MNEWRPDHIAKFRAETHKSAGMYNWRTKKCDGCKKTRSPAQFKADSDVCQQCKGL